MTHETVTSEITAPKGRTKAVVFSLLILLSGIIIGSGITLIVVGPRQQPDGLPGPEFFSRRMVEHWTRELSLTPEQVEQIQPVVDEHMKVLDDYRRAAQPKIRTEIDTMNNEILEILDDQQKQMFKDKIEQMQRHFQEMRQRRGNDDRRRNGDRRGDGPPRGDRDDRPRRRRGGGRGDPNAPQFPPPMPANNRFEPGQMPSDQPPRPEPDSPEQPQ